MIETSVGVAARFGVRRPIPSSGHQPLGSSEPLRPLEPAVFLDRPVDALDDLSRMHRDPACPVRQLVPTLLLTVLGVNVDERLAEAGARQIDYVQPVLLDRELSLDVVREQVTRDSKLLIADIEVRPNETDEEP